MGETNIGDESIVETGRAGKEKQKVKEFGSILGYNFSLLLSLS